MRKNKKAGPKKKKKAKRLHERNRNQDRYDLEALIEVKQELKNFLKPNKHGVETIDFSQAEAVKLLNQAILHHYYGISNWDFPPKYLCPPIPGRADYLHYLADLLREDNFGKIPSKGVKVFDVGTGASCIYPIIGVTEYNWNFIASDVNPEAINSAKNIVENNPSLKNKIDCRLQEDPHSFFSGIIRSAENFDLTMCNPPFHGSIEEAREGNIRKVENLTGKEVLNPKRNFSGVREELIYEGGEYAFIKAMINESKEYADHCFWFSSLVSKKTNLDKIYSVLDAVGTQEVRTLDMATGNKTSRIVAWTFLSPELQKEWKISRWSKKKISTEEE